MKDYCFFVNSAQRYLIEDPDHEWEKISPTLCGYTKGVEKMSLVELREAVAEDLLTLLRPTPSKDFAGEYFDSGSFGGIVQEELFAFIRTDPQRWRVSMILEGLINRGIVLRHGNFLSLSDQQESLDKLWDRTRIAR